MWELEKGDNVLSEKRNKYNQKRDVVHIGILNVTGSVRLLSKTINSTARLLHTPFVSATCVFLKLSGKPLNCIISIKLEIIPHQ